MWTQLIHKTIPHIFLYIRWNNLKACLCLSCSLLWSPQTIYHSVTLNVRRLWSMIHITTTDLHGWLSTNVSWQAIDSVWSCMFLLLNCADTIRAGLQMWAREMMAVYWSWIVPWRKGSVVFLSDGKIRGDR